MEVGHKTYLNLTNGIEALPLVKSGNYSFIRIQSTTLESNNYLKLLQELDYDFLLHLALGWECTVIDFGTNRKLSKTIYKGIPLIKYVLERFWLDQDNDCYFFARDGSRTMLQTDYVRTVYNQLFLYDSNKEKNLLKMKLKYFKRYLNTNSIYLIGKSESTSNDGNIPYYKQILVDNLCK